MLVHFQVSNMLLALFEIQIKLETVLVGFDYLPVRLLYHVVNF